MPRHWTEILRENVWQYMRLPRAQRAKLDAWVRVFVAERHWEGCDGLAIDDRIRVTIAGQAGIAVLGHDDWYFDRTPSILVYPAEYTVRDVIRPAGGGLTIVGDEDRSGEAWYRGPVVLSFPDCLAGGRSANGGRNLVIHEFAHQLDMIGDPSADGKPPMPDKQTDELWNEVMPAELALLRYECASGLHRLLDCYGATNPAEFFAVASETFFQRPSAMHQQKEKLYQTLRAFYRVDPEQWL
jgi:Mlc titration factor MtfA (ptsG expression regulator)